MVHSRDLNWIGGSGNGSVFIVRAKGKVSRNDNSIHHSNNWSITHFRGRFCYLWGFHKSSPSKLFSILCSHRKFRHEQFGGCHSGFACSGIFIFCHFKEEEIMVNSTRQPKHARCHEINAGAASRPTNQVKVRPTIKLNIPQLARLGLFSRFTQGRGLANLFQFSTPGSLSVRDATAPTVSGDMEPELPWQDEAFVEHWHWPPDRVKNTDENVRYFKMAKTRSTGSADFNLGSLARPYCHATTVTFTGNFARGGMLVNFKTSPSISAGPSRTT